jgi:uncharacterized protein
MSKTILAFACGLLFAVGLGLAGMTRPEKVLGFLDVAGGAWDATLAFVMGPAVAVYMVCYRLARGRAAPLLGGALQLPARRDLDPALIGGAALFGAGWGLSGFCPGPAIVSTVSGATSVLAFVAAMTGGALLYRAALAARPAAVSSA